MCARSASLNKKLSAFNLKVSNEGGVVIWLQSRLVVCAIGNLQFARGKDVIEPLVFPAPIYLVYIAVTVLFPKNVTHSEMAEPFDYL